jgi:hypothetical protein
MIMEDTNNNIKVEPNKPSKKQGFFNFILGFFRRFFGKKTVAKKVKLSKPIESMGGRGHYFDGNGADGYYSHSSQRQRRKMERRTGRR